VRQFEQLATRRNTPSYSTEGAKLAKGLRLYKSWIDQNGFPERFVGGYEDCKSEEEQGGRFEYLAYMQRRQGPLNQLCLLQVTESTQNFGRGHRCFLSLVQLHYLFGLLFRTCRERLGRKTLLHCHTSSSPPRRCGHGLTTDVYTSPHHALQLLHRHSPYQP
jgi:hypothetical protein